MTQAFPLFGRTAVSQTEKAYCALEEMIVTGELPPGSQWSETTLSERVGIGRSPVRDALQKLAFQRLVEIAPRQGIFISEIDYQGQLKIIQARREIERLIVAQAAQWADDGERAELTQLARELEDLKAVNDMRMYMRLHFTLTSQIGAASRNSYAAEFHAMLQTLARRFLYFHQKRHPDLVQICAIVEGSVERAIATAEARNDYAENLARNILMELIVTSAVTISKPPRGRSGAD
jgi:DNA-binding GntR family transcriptional regulator